MGLLIMIDGTFLVAVVMYRPRMLTARLPVAHQQPLLFPRPSSPKGSMLGVSRRGAEAALAHHLWQKFCSDSSLSSTRRVHSLQMPCWLAGPGLTLCCSGPQQATTEAAKLVAAASQAWGHASWLQCP